MGGHGSGSGFMSKSKQSKIKAEADEVSSKLANGEIKLGEAMKQKKAIAQKYGITIKELSDIQFGGSGSQVEELKKAVEAKKKSQAVSAVGEELRGDRQPASGRGVPPYYNTTTQSSHPYGGSAADIMSRTGVSAEKADQFYDAINGGSEGGFTRGWDSVIRAYQRGATRKEILDMPGTKSSISSNFGGNESAFFAKLAQKSSACEELIDRSPKWKGKMLYRGFRGLDSETISRLTDTTPGTLINLNAGTASWTTSSTVASNFSSGWSGRLIAHVSGSENRRATSIKASSHYKSEDEVLASRREAFVCTKVVNKGGVVHAYYKVVDTDYDWSDYQI